MSGLAEAAAELRALADRLEHPEPAFARAAELCADATRRGIESQGLVASGELEASVYANGSAWGVAAPYASHVEARRPFVPVGADGELVEPLATDVRAVLEAHLRGDS